MVDYSGAGASRVVRGGGFGSSESAGPGVEFNPDWRLPSPNDADEDMEVEEAKNKEKMSDAQGEDEEMKSIGLLRQAGVPDM